MGIYNNSWIVIVILLGHYFLIYFENYLDPTPTRIVIIAAEMVVGMVVLFNFELAFFWVGLKECLLAWASEFSLFSSIFVPSTCLGTTDYCSLCVRDWNGMEGTFKLKLWLKFFKWATFRLLAMHDKWIIHWSFVDSSEPSKLCFFRTVKWAWHTYPGLACQELTPMFCFIPAHWIHCRNRTNSSGSCCFHTMTCHTGLLSSQNDLVHRLAVLPQWPSASVAEKRNYLVLLTRCYVMILHNKFILEFCFSTQKNIKYRR